jgi:hypothetical protein
MAGGIKVAVSPAVGPWPWGWETGSCRAVRLLLVLSGCLVCGSGTIWEAATKGASANGVIFGKVGRGPLLWWDLELGERSFAGEWVSG